MFIYYQKINVVVFVDSIVKGLNAWKKTKKNNSCKFSVISFFGVNVQGIKDYIKPTCRKRANHFINHVELTDVSDQNKSPDAIPESIFNL